MTSVRESGSVEDRKLDVLLDRLRETIGNNKSDSLEDAGPNAAVSLIVRPDRTKADFFLLLVKRSYREADPWSGDMALPGGRRSNLDKNLLETVVREVREETSIDLGDCSFLGTLDDVVPGNRSLRVRPFVYLASDDLGVEINLNEIKSYFWIPLSFFLSENNTHPYLVERFGVQMQVQSYKFQNEYFVWGMTLRIIKDFISRVYPKSADNA